MGNFKNSIEELMSWFINNSIINSVTFGDLNDIDLDKSTTFPLAHIIPVSYGITGSVFRNTVTIELLQLSKNNEEDKIKALDEMSEVIDDFFKYAEDKHEINIISSDVIFDQLQARLFGWSISIEKIGLVNGCT
jgi:predicted small metal-binding protein